MDELRNRVAVITGGGSGIGLGIAHALADKGVHVVIADIELDLAHAAAHGLRDLGVRALAVRCDVSERSSVEDLAERAWREYGHVDIIVNNAGVLSPAKPLIDTSELDARWVLEVNLLGVWHGCSVFGKRFVLQGTPAHIVNTGSEHSLGIVNANSGFYTASKHAVLGLTEVLREELPDFIGVSILLPGMVHSDLPNASRNRPDRFGGPSSSGSETPAPANFGMNPGEYGRHVVTGIQRNDFYIVTHPPVRVLIEERYTALLHAFDMQAPRYEGDEILDTRVRIRNIARDSAQLRD